MKRLILLFFIILLKNIIYAQNNMGDYRTKSSGDWSDPLIWERFDGSDWQAATSAPSFLDRKITIRSSHTVNVSSIVTIDETYVESGGTLTILGSGNLVLNYNIDPAIIVAGILNIYGGGISGNGLATIYNTVNWTSGSIEQATITFPSVSSQLNISGNFNKSLKNGARINQYGQTRFTGTGNLTGGGGAFFYNYGSATFLIENDAAFTTDQSGNITFENEGILRKSGTSGSTSFLNNFTLNNKNLINVQSGCLEFFSNGTQMGSFNIATNSKVSFKGGINYLNNANFYGSGSVEIDGGNIVILSENNTLSSGLTFNFINGEISGSGKLESSAIMNWSGGTLNQAKIKNNSTLNISASSYVIFINNAIVYNHNELNWNGSGNIYGGNDSKILNYANFNIQNNSIFKATSGGYLSLENMGTITKSSLGVTTFTDNGVLINFSNGTINIQQGTLEANSNCILNGNLVINANSILLLNGGQHTIGQVGNCSLNGSGIFKVNAKVNILNTCTIANNVKTEFLGGEIIGSGKLETYGIFEWKNGIISINNFEIKSSGILFTSESTGKYFGAGVLNNYGEITFQTAQQISNSSPYIINNFGIIQITSDINFNVLNNYFLVINNYGNLIKASSNGKSLFSTKTIINNYGNLFVTAGGIELHGSGISEGEIRIDDNCEMSFLGKFTFKNNSKISGIGQFNFIKDTISINGDNVFEGNIKIDSGIVYFNSYANINRLDIIKGSLLGSGSLRFLIGSWQGGEISIDSIYLKTSGILELNINKTNLLNFSGNLINKGTINLTKGNLKIHSGGMIINLGEFNVLENNNIFISSNSFLNNYGIFAKKNYQGSASVEQNFINQANGTISISNGVLKFCGKIFGNVYVNSNSTLEFIQHSEVDLADNSDFIVNGEVRITNDSVIFKRGDNYFIQKFQMTNGICIFKIPIQIQNLFSDSGILIFCDTTFINFANINNSQWLEFKEFSQINEMNVFSGLVLFSGSNKINISKLKLDNDGQISSTCNIYTNEFIFNNGIFSTNDTLHIIPKTSVSVGYLLWKGGIFRGPGTIIIENNSRSELDGELVLDNLEFILRFSSNSKIMTNSSLSLINYSKIIIENGALLTAEEGAYSEITGDNGSYVYMHPNATLEQKTNLLKYSIPIINKGFLKIAKSKSSEIRKYIENEGIIFSESNSSIYIYNTNFYAQNGSAFVDSGKIYFIETEFSLNGNVTNYSQIYMSNKSHGYGTLINNGYLEWHCDTLSFDIENKGEISLGKKLTLGNAAITSYGIFRTNNFYVDGIGDIIIQDSSILATSHPEGITNSLLTGCLRNNGFRYVPSSAIYQYEGGNEQFTGDALPDTVLSLIIDKPSNYLNLSKKLIIKNELKILNGKIRAIVDTLTLGLNSLYPGVLSNDNGIVFGFFKRWVSSLNYSQDLCFPLGDNWTQRKAILNFVTPPANPGTITATFVSNDPSNRGLPLYDSSTAIVNIFSQGYWKIEKDNLLSVDNYLLTLAPANIIGVTNPKTLYIVYRKDSIASWTLHGEHMDGLGNIDTPLVRSRNLRFFGEFTIASNSENQLGWGNPRPALSTIQPGFAYRGDTINVYFYGANFINGISNLAAKNINIDTFYVIDSIRISARLIIPENDKIRDVYFKVYNQPPGGGYSDSVKFSIINYKPSNFSLLFPKQNDTLFLNHYQQYEFTWKKSFDKDKADTVKYIFRLFGENFDTVVANILDTSICINVCEILSQNKFYTWEVFATDNIDTVKCNEAFNFFVYSIPTTQKDEAAFKKEFSLYQNYPNPFNPITTIEFALAEDGWTKLAVYDLLGREIEVLVDEYLTADKKYKIVFNAKNFSSGAYYYMLISGKKIAVKKLMIIK